MAIHYPAHLKKIVASGANMQSDTTALYPEPVAEIKRDRIHADSMQAAKTLRKTGTWYSSGTDELNKIQVPVLVLSCDRDVIKEEHTFFIYRNIKNAHLAILPGESHHVPRQNPTLFNTTIDRFLSQHSGIILTGTITEWWVQKADDKASKLHKHLN